MSVKRSYYYGKQNEKDCHDRTFCGSGLCCHHVHPHSHTRDQRLHSSGGCHCDPFRDHPGSCLRIPGRRYRFLHGRPFGGIFYLRPHHLCHKRPGGTVCCPCLQKDSKRQQNSLGRRPYRRHHRHGAGCRGLLPV